jgi:hypothetical protein
MPIIEQPISAPNSADPALLDSRANSMISKAHDACVKARAAFKQAKSTATERRWDLMRAGYAYYITAKADGEEEQVRQRLNHAGIRFKVTTDLLVLIMRWLTNDKDKASRWAKVCRWAYSCKVGPDHLIDFIRKNGGVEACARTFRRSSTAETDNRPADGPNFIAAEEGRRKRTNDLRQGASNKIGKDIRVEIDARCKRQLKSLCRKWPRRFVDVRALVSKSGRLTLIGVNNDRNTLLRQKLKLQKELRRARAK